MVELARNLITSPTPDWPQPCGIGNLRILLAAFFAGQFHLKGIGDRGGQSPRLPDGWDLYRYGVFLPVTSVPLAKQSTGSL